MVSTMTRPAPAAVRPPSGRGVKVPELVLGVLLVAGSALGGLLWWSSATASTTVAVFGRDVGRGSVVTEADLRLASVPAGGDLALVPWAERDRVVGRVLTADVRAGAPALRSLTQEAPLLSPAEGLVGLRLEPGAAPALAPGDVVDVVAIPATGEVAAVAATVVASAASVWSVGPVGESATDVLVTLRLPVDAARTVGAAADRVRLVQIGDQP